LEGKEISKIFEFKLNGDRDIIMNRLHTLAREHDIKCEGDHVSGRILGKGFRGSYQFQQNSVIVTIEQKPWIVSWALAEKEISAFFQSDQI
jgi:hypothetical protein